MNRIIKISNLRQHLMIRLTLSQKKASKHIIIKQIIQRHRNSKHQFKNLCIIMSQNMTNMRKNMKIILKTLEIMVVLLTIHIHHSRKTLSQKTNQIIILAITTPKITIQIQTKLILIM